jgi:two-component system response regulator HupR/HoxA
MAGMDSSRRYPKLRSITMLRDVIRKWWQTDLYFADASGWCPEFDSGSVLPAGNDFCRALLAAPEGRRRCGQSVRELSQHLRRSKERTPVSYTCHLGLNMLASRAQAGNHILGFAFCCGFLSRELSRTRILRLRAAVTELLPEKLSLEAERVPLISHEEIERLKDLLTFCAGETAIFERELNELESNASRKAADFETLVAHSPPMHKLLPLLRQEAMLPTPLLLVGEPGSGKRTIAQAVHRAGPRHAFPFLELTGSADPAAAELQLFGQARGGSLLRIGLCERAAGGTLFLSGETLESPTVQVKLQRLMQEGTIVPSGAGRPVDVDVRLIWGLNKDLDALVAAQRFRPDVAELLDGHRLTVPPLRERAEDLATLTDLLLQRFSGSNRSSVTVHPDTLALFGRYDWPGNGRELEDELRRLLSLTGRDGQLLPERVATRIRLSTGLGPPIMAKALQGTPRLRDAIAILEREIIQEGLIRTQGNKSLLARQLGISRSSLLAKIAEYGLPRLPEHED